MAYLFVEEELEGNGTGNYHERYFTLVPFCGLQWHLDKPPPLSSNAAYPTLPVSQQQQQAELVNGWVFGGSILVKSVNIEASIEQDMDFGSGLASRDLHPFVMVLQSNDHTTQVRLASNSVEERAKWVTDINDFASMQLYLMATSENDCPPNGEVFNGISEINTRNVVEFQDLIFSDGMLRGFSRYVQLACPHGSVLRSLSLQGCGLGDDSAPLLRELLDQLPHLSTLCLAENSLSDDGADELSLAIRSMKALHNLDLSGNAIGDRGLIAIIDALVSCPNLQGLELSRNNLTAASIRPLTTKLAIHSAKFTHLGLAYNKVGDGVAALVSLLMYNTPSLLEVVDVSFCGITDLGVREMAASLPQCSTLRSLIVRGCFVNPSTMVLLTEALSEQQTKFSKIRRGKTEGGATLHIGGLEAHSHEPKCLAFQSVRRAIPYIGDRSLLRHVLLRKRLPQAQENDPSINTNAVAIIPMVCLRVKLPSFCYSISEVLERLAEHIGAYVRQLQVISTSDFDNITRSCYVVFTLLEPNPEMEYLRVSGTFEAKMVSRLSLPAAAALMETAPPKQLNSVDEILVNLREKADELHPMFAKLGIHTVFIQCPPSILNPDPIFTCNIAGELSVQQAIQHNTVTPQLSPTFWPQAEKPDECLLDGQAPVSNALNITLRLKNDNVKKINTTSVEKNSKVLAVEMKRREKRVAKMVSRRERRIQNEQLILSVRKLKGMNQISSESAMFWEGALGNAKYKPILLSAMKAFLDDAGVFPVVGLCMKMLDAMHARDMQPVASVIMHVKDEKLNSSEAQYLQYAERLSSDILSIQRDAINLHRLARSADDIGIVEDFLLSCGRAGYSGPEMFAAVELRQKLVIMASQQKPDIMRAEIGFIKQRALITNLMISRNFDGLREALTRINIMGDERMLELAEVFAAKKLLSDSVAVFGEIRDCSHSKNIVMMMEVLSHAAYVGVSRQAEEVVHARYELALWGADGKALLFPLLAGLRAGDFVAIDDALCRSADMGWRIEALDPELPMLIVSKRAELVEEDSVQSHVIRLALAIRNGFRVNHSELFQALRKSKILNIYTKPSLRVYFSALDDHMARNAGLVKQEETIQTMMSGGDVNGLEELLSGRGTARLVVNAPSAELARAWIQALNESCAEDPLVAKEAPVRMLGTMEKAARTETGVLRGWRHRYFVLEDGLLSYFVSRGGEKKGAVRVSGGRVRSLSLDESGGRAYAFELQEGKDLSQIDASLLKEGRAFVRKHRIGTLKKSLQAAMHREKLHEIKRLLSELSDNPDDDDIDIDFVHKVKRSIKKLEDRELKLDMRRAAHSIHPGTMEMCVQRALSAQIDPNNFLFSHLVRLVEQSEVTQCIIRARCAAQARDESAFKRAVTILSRYEVKRFSMRDSRMISAVVLQHAAYRVLSLYSGGECIGQLCQLVEHALTCCRVFSVETEPMQLGRLLISLASTSKGKHNHFQATNTTAGLGGYIENSRLPLYTTAQYALDRFPNINGPDLSEKGGFFTWKSKPKSIQSQVAGQAAIVEMLTWSTKPLAQPLIKGLNSRDALCVLPLFGAMQAVLGDEPLKRVRKTADGFLKKRADVAWVAADLCTVGREQANMRDELYVQLSKQISGNPKVFSRLRGWLLFSIYLHAFPPSAAITPYLKNFIVHSAAAESTILPESMANIFAELKGDALKAARRDLVLSRRDVARISTYCLKVLNRIDVASSKATNDIADTHDGLFAKQVDREIAGCVLGRANVTFQVVLMTGSVYQFSVKYGEVDSPSSVLPLLYGRLAGGPEELKEIAGFEEFAGIVSKSKSPATQDAWNDWLLKQFRGFSFYSATGDLVDEFAGARINQLPVHPDEDSQIPWSHDLLWDLVTQRVEATRKEMHKVATDSKGTKDTMKMEETMQRMDNYCTMRLVLRRSTACNSEQLAGQFDMFRDQVSDKDIVNLRQFWIEFLSPNGSGGGCVVPTDHLRVDLLFAEDTRMTNARLYGGAGDAFAYLISLQLALGWSDCSTHEWAAADDGVLGGVDASVRPIMRGTYAREMQSGTKPNKRRVGSQLAGSRVSAYFRRSVAGGGDVEKLGMLLKRKMRLQSMSGASSEVTSLLDADAETKEEGEDVMNEDNKAPAELEAAESTEDDSSSSDASSDDLEIDYDYDDDEVDMSSADSNDESVNYSEDQSTDEDDAETKATEVDGARETPESTYARRRPKAPIRSMEDMTPYELAELESKLMALGVSIEECGMYMEDIVEWIAKFHSIALENKCELDSPAYRYMIKRAYLHYCMSLPLYGSNYSDSVFLSADGPREVTVAFTTHSVRFLDPVTWVTVLEASLCDIESCKFYDEIKEDAEDDLSEVEGSALDNSFSEEESASDKDSDDGSSVDSDNKRKETLKEKRVDKDKEKIKVKANAKAKAWMPTKGSSSGPRIIMNINGSKIELIGPHAEQQMQVVERCCMEALSRGVYPHGTEGGDDVIEVGESISALSDCREILRRFVREFPLLVVPPSPLPLTEAPDFVDLPKSRREIIAEARAEEELLELEQARLAAEKLIEEMSRQRARGKKEVKAFAADSDGSESDGDEGARRSNKESKSKDKGKGRKGETEDGIIGRQSYNTMSNLQGKINNAACGVPVDRYAENAGGTSIAVPTKRNGKYKIDKIQRVRLQSRPVLRRTALPDPSTLPPVSVAFGLDAHNQVREDVLSAFSRIGSAHGYHDDSDEDADSTIEYSQFARSFSGRSLANQQNTNKSQDFVSTGKHHDTAEDYVPLSPKKR